MREVRFPPIKQTGLSPGSYEPQKVIYNTYKKYFL